MKNLRISIKKFFASKNPFRKGTKLYSILKLKCPKCQEGDLFLVKNPYNLKMFDKMPDRCSHCNENFVRESGFYWGAMMVSHATTTILSVMIHFIIYPFYGWDVIPNMLAIISMFILLLPVIFRSSRAVWINFFVKYDPSYQETSEKT